MTLRVLAFIVRRATPALARVGIDDGRDPRLAPSSSVRGLAEHVERDFGDSRRLRNSVRHASTSDLSMLTRWALELIRDRRCVLRRQDRDERNPRDAGDIVGTARHLLAPHLPNLRHVALRRCAALLESVAGLTGSTLSSTARRSGCSFFSATPRAVRSPATVELLNSGRLLSEPSEAVGRHE